MTTSLLTDHYELTMLDAALRSGSVERSEAGLLPDEAAGDRKSETTILGAG